MNTSASFFERSADYNGGDIVAHMTTAQNTIKPFKGFSKKRDVIVEITKLSFPISELIDNVQ